MTSVERKGKRIARMVNRLSPEAMTITFKIINVSEELLSDGASVPEADSYLIVQQCLKTNIMTMHSERETVTIYSRTAKVTDEWLKTVQDKAAKQINKDGLKWKRAFQDSCK